MKAYLLEFVPGHFKMQEMCNEAVRREPYTLHYVSDHLNTQEMCDEAVRNKPYLLEFVEGYRSISKLSCRPLAFTSCTTMLA